MAEPFYALARSYGVEETSVNQVQRVLSAALRGFARAEASGAYPTSAAADDTFAQIIDLFDLALQTRSWPTVRP